MRKECGNTSEGSKKAKYRQKDDASTREVKCPFFESHSEKEICCEGIMEGCRHVMVFEDRNTKRFFSRVYCKDQYGKCEYYRMLMQEKYEEEQSSR